MAIINLFKPITFFVCNVLLIVSGTLQAMEVKNLGIIPLESDLLDMAALEPDALVICTWNNGNNYEIQDSAGIKKSYHQNDATLTLSMLLPISDSEIMLFDLMGSSVNKLDVTSGGFTCMFDLFNEPLNIRPQNMVCCSVIKPGLIQLSYVDQELNCNVKIFNYKDNKVEQELSTGSGTPGMITIGEGKYIYFSRFKQSLCVWNIDTCEDIKNIEIPIRPKNVWSNDDNKNFEISKICYLGTKYIALGWEDGLVSIWNLETEEKSQEIKAHDGWISSIINIGKNFFVTGGDDGLVKTWHISSDECQHVFDGHKTDASPQINKLVLLSGDRVASATKSNIQISRALWK